MWEGTEATDIASQQESSALTSIWNGVKNLFTPEEIAVELVELRGPLAAPVNEIPRLLSANMVTELDEEEMDMLRVEWDEIPEVEDQLEFMSVEWVDDLAARELAVDAEFAPTLEQIELMNMELPELAGAMFEDSMMAGDLAVAMADVSSLLIPMEVELGADAGPIAGAVGGALGGVMGAAVGWTTLATVAAVAAIAAGVFVGAWYLAVWISGAKDRNHQWKLKYEDFNWIKAGTIGWIALGVEEKQLFYPFICTGIVDYDNEKYTIRFLDVFRIAHEMEMHFDHNVILMLPFWGARQEQWVSLKTYLNTPLLRDTVHNPDLRVWPYIYKINAEEVQSVVPFYRKFATGTIVRMRKTGRLGYISKLPSLKNPVYKITGKLSHWSALPNQFDYLLNTDVPPPQQSVPTVPGAAPKIEDWMNTEGWGETQKKLDNEIVVEDVHPRDVNGKKIFEGDRVFIIPDLKFGVVDHTRKMSVITWNDFDVDNSHTYRPFDILVVVYSDSESDIFKKYRDLKESDGVEYGDNSTVFIFNDAKGNPIHVGDTVRTLDDPTQATVLYLNKLGKVRVDYGGSTTSFDPLFLLKIVPDDKPPIVPPKKVPDDKPPIVPPKKVPDDTPPIVPPKKVPDDKPPTTISDRVQDVTKVIPDPKVPDIVLHAPDVTYDGNWPVFMQTKMVNNPPLENKKKTNNGIDINPFNQFRRRLPGISGGMSGGFAKISQIGWEASPKPQSSDEKMAEVDPETRTRLEKLAGYETEENSGGGSSGVLIIAGIIVAFLFFA